MPYRNPVASTAGFLLLPAFDANIHLQPASMMIGRMTGAFGADDVVSLGAQFRKLRFQMIADMCREGLCSTITQKVPKPVPPAPSERRHQIP